jgi:hypothetical protein
MIFDQNASFAFENYHGKVLKALIVPDPGTNLSKIGSYFVAL